MGNKIVVVDDDPVIRILVTEYLATQGHEVEVCSSGKECLTRLSKSGGEVLPDIVILDLLMPEMSGAEVLQKIRNNKDTASLPVIMLSANSEAQAVTKTYNVRADSYIQKPFVIQTILDAVKLLSPKNRVPTQTTFAKPD